MNNLLGFLKWGKKSEPEKRILNPIIKENVDPNEKWETLKAIGDGSFGEVYQIRNRDKGNFAALKQVKHENGDDLEDALVEIDILTECNHKNIIQIYDVYLNKEILWIVLEFCDAGALDSIMSDLEKPLTEGQLRFVCHEVVDGLAFLHQKWIIHRDLKAGNILLTTDGKVKLADFGVSAKNKEEKQKRSTYIGSTYWMAPEVINCEMSRADPYDYSADIWSLGVTMIELAEMYPPHHEMNPGRAAMKIYKAEPPTLRNSKHWSPQFSQFLGRCLLKQPDKRASAEELKQHPFISSITENDNSEMKLLIGEAKADVTIMEEDVDAKSMEDRDSLQSSDKLIEEENETPTNIIVVKTNNISQQPDALILQEIPDPILLQMVDDIIMDVLTSETRSPSVASVVLEFMQDTTNIDEIIEDLNRKENDQPKPIAAASTARRNSYKLGNDEEDDKLFNPPATLTSPPANGDLKHITDLESKKEGGSSLNKRTSRYRTLTRRRVFVFEGKEIVTQTTKVIDAEKEEIVLNELMERRHETREMRALANLERRVHEKYEQSCQTQRLTQASKAKQDELNTQKHHEQEKESIMKEQKEKLEKLKADHNADLKQIMKTKKMEFNKEEQLMRQQQTTERQNCKRSWSNVSRDERLRMRENLEAKHNEEVQNLRQRQEEVLKDAKDDFNRKFVKKLEEMEMQFVKSRHALIRDYETKRQQNEENCMNTKQQSERTHTLGRYKIFKSNLCARRDKELERLKLTMGKETEQLIDKQNVLRRTRPREIDQMYKARREIFRKSLVLPSQNPLSPDEIKHKMKEFQRTETERKQDELDELEKRFSKQRDTLERKQAARYKEVEQMYNEKQQVLLKKEIEAMRDLEKLFRYQKDQLKQETVQRREAIENELRAELQRIEKFYQNSTNRGSMPEFLNHYESDRLFSQSIGSWSQSQFASQHSRPTIDNSFLQHITMSDNYGSPRV